MLFHMPEATGDASESICRLLEESFPQALCASSEPALIVAHLRSEAFGAAPLRARSAAAVLAQADEVSLDVALTTLCEGLRQRGGSIDGTEPARLELLRALFVCAVLLLDVALSSSAPPAVVARHADVALKSLAKIALGAVGMPQLVALEHRLLDTLGECGRLRPVVLEVLASGFDNGPSDSSPGLEGGTGGAPSALALRWATVALGQPSLAQQLWPSLPVLLDASTQLRAARGGPEGVAASAAVHVLRAALGGLWVELPEQLQLARALVVQLGMRCLDLLQLEQAARQAYAHHAPMQAWQGTYARAREVPSDTAVPGTAVPKATFGNAASGNAAGEATGGVGGGATAQVAGAVPGAAPGSAPGAAPPPMPSSLVLPTRAAVLCALLFGLLPVIKEPVLPALCDTARMVVLCAPGDTRSAVPGNPRVGEGGSLAQRTAVQLRDAILAAVEGPRKLALVDWLQHVRHEQQEIVARRSAL